MQTEQNNKNNNKNKKAQMEILGLVIIVVLISLGLLFYIKFSVFNTSSDVQNFYSRTRIAVNTPNTLLATTIPECSKKTIQELLRDCATSEVLVCTTGERSCEASNRIITSILDKSLKERHISYDFTATIKGVPKPKVNVTNKGCPLEKESETFPVRLYPDPRTLLVRLNVC